MAEGRCGTRTGQERPPEGPGLETAPGIPFQGGHVHTRDRIRREPVCTAAPLPATAERAGSRRTQTRTQGGHRAIWGFCAFLVPKRPATGTCAPGTISPAPVCKSLGQRGTERTWPVAGHSQLEPGSPIMPLAGVSLVPAGAEGEET